MARYVIVDGVRVGLRMSMPWTNQHGARGTTLSLEVEPDDLDGVDALFRGPAVLVLGRGENVPATPTELDALKAHAEAGGALDGPHLLQLLERLADAEEQLGAARRELEGRREERGEAAAPDAPRYPWPERLPSMGEWLRERAIARGDAWRQCVRCCGARIASGVCEECGAECPIEPPQNDARRAP